ncbi:MAG TPA: hypothetical protein VH112_00260 [Acidimicrobiales bacterium]|jgi:hypothetical protein|nr:hypothetical protein [Acidimicrobiales bacterium]
MRAAETDPGALARSVADAASAVAGVARLSSTGPVEVATYFAGGKVNGFRLRDGKAWVHIVIDRLPLEPVAEAVRAAVTAVMARLGQSCEVVVVVEGLELDHLPPPSVTPLRPKKTRV